MGFSRKEYWSGLPFPSPGDLPDPGIEPGSPALQTDALPSQPPGKGGGKGAKISLNDFCPLILFSGYFRLALMLFMFFSISSSIGSNRTFT